MERILRKSFLVCVLSIISLSAYPDTRVVVVPIGDDGPPDRYVFVTEGIWTGDLGGPEGADAKCQAEADAEGSLVQGRTFMAWVSGGLANDFSISGNSGRHFDRSAGAYRQPTGLLVAKNYKDLLINGPTNAIREHADGSTDTSSIGTYAWTGIDADGSYSEDRCTDVNGNDWSTFDFNQYGESGDDSAPHNWTDSTAFPQVQCNYLLAVYCFEQ